MTSGMTARSSLSTGMVTNTSWSSPMGGTLPSYGGSTEGVAGTDYSTADGEEFLARAGVKKGRPVVVFVETKTEVRDSGGHTYDQSHFADERVAIGAKIFGLLKVREGTPLAKSDALAGGSSPRFVVFDGKGRRVGAVEGSPSASRLYGLMKQAVAASYARSLEVFVREYRRLLDGIDQVEAEKEAVLRHRDRLAATPSEGLRKKIEAMESEIKATSDALVAKERELLQLPEKTNS